MADTIEPKQPTRKMHDRIIADMGIVVSPTAGEWHRSSQQRAWRVAGLHAGLLGVPCVEATAQYGTKAFAEGHRVGYWLRREGRPAK